jgi:hypothetical protein
MTEKGYRTGILNVYGSLLYLLFDGIGNVASQHFDAQGIFAAC